MAVSNCCLNASRLVERFGAAALQGGGPTFMCNFLAGILLGNKWFTRHVIHVVLGR